MLNTTKVLETQMKLFFVWANKYVHNTYINTVSGCANGYDM